MQQSLIVIDNFYDDPSAIRTLALGLDFKQKSGATYPGKEAYVDNPIWEQTRLQLATFVHQDIGGECPKSQPFLQGKFRVAVAADQNKRIDGVHEDVQPWSGVVYLSDPEHCNGQGAIAFYEHRDTGLREPTDEWWMFISLKLGFSDLDNENRKKAYWDYMRDTSNWIELEHIENVFNRAVLLYAQRFHASIGLFGDEVINGRLTQHFEYYYS